MIIIIDNNDDNNINDNISNDNNNDNPTPRIQLSVRSFVRPSGFFYRFNAKNWRFLQIKREKVAFFFLQI